MIDTSFVMLMYCTVRNNIIAILTVSGSPFPNADNVQFLGISAGESSPERQSKDRRATVRSSEPVQDVQFLQ